MHAVLDVTGANPSGEAPLSAAEITCRAAQILTACGAAKGALKAGALAPGFSLQDGKGRTVSLSGALALGPAVITFHGGLWCPNCTVGLRALETALPDYRSQGAALLAISPQTPAHNRAAASEAGISFPLLADVHNRVAASFGVLVKLGPDLMDLYRQSCVDLPAYKGVDNWALPLPARFVIAPDRTILYAEVSVDFGRLPDPLELMPVLKSASLRVKLR